MRRLSAVPAALALAGGFLSFGPTAAAGDRPIAGTPECTTLVSAEATVKAAQAAVDAAGAGATASLKAELSRVTLAAEAKLCAPASTPTTTTTPRTTTTTATTSSAPTTSRGGGSSSSSTDTSTGVTITNLPDVATAPDATTSGRQVTEVPQGAADTGDGSTVQ